MGNMTVREAGRLGGSVKSEKKTLAVRENAKKAGRKPLPLEKLACTCKDATEGHKSACPRGRAIKRRAKKGAE